MKKLTEKLKKIKLLVLDFDGVMTDNRVLVSEDGKESVFCNRGDGLGIDMLKKKGIEVIVISKERNKVVKARCKKLKIKCFNGIDNKKQTLLRKFKKRRLKKENVCFVGNDINDIECLEAAGFKAAINESHKSVLKIADYVTKKTGGKGAVREIAELILGSKK